MASKELSTRCFHTHWLTRLPLAGKKMTGSLAVFTLYLLCAGTKTIADMASVHTANLARF